MSIVGTHDQLKLPSVERYPIADDFFQQETIELVLGLAGQAASIRRKGGLPGTRLYDIDFAADITLDMDEGYKERLIDYQHQLFLQALENQELRNRINSPNPVEVQWQGSEQPIRTIFTRLTKDIALAENTYLGMAGQPVRYRPMIWVGRDALNFFVKTQIKGADRNT